MMGDMAMETLRAFARLHGVEWHFVPDAQLWTTVEPLPDSDFWYPSDTECECLEDIHYYLSKDKTA